MLKGKKSIYVLLPVVLFIWGTILYQVTDAFSDEESLIASVPKPNFIPIEVKEKDTFSLEEVKRDPFLNTIYVKPKKINPVPKKPVKKIVNWPNIHYKGIVSPGDTKNAIYLIQINNQDFLFKIGQTEEGITLLKGSKEQLKLRFKGQFKQYQRIGHYNY